MYFVNFANCSDEKFHAKGKTIGEHTHKWLMLGKENSRQGVLTIVEKQSYSEAYAVPFGYIWVELNMFSKSKFSFAKALRFAERWAAKHGYNSVNVTVCFSAKELKQRQSCDNVWQAEQCLQHGYKFSKRFVETGTLSRKACESIKWVRSRLLRTSEQGSFNSEEGYRIVRYQDLDQEDIPAMKKEMQENFADFVHFNPNSQDHDMWLSHVVYKGNLLVAFLSMGIRKPGDYFVEGVAAHKDYPGAGMVTMKQLVYDIGNFREDCKTINCEFFPECNDGRRLFMSVFGKAFTGYTRRIYLCKNLNKHHGPKEHKLDVLDFVLKLENTMDLSKLLKL